MAKRQKQPDTTPAPPPRPALPTLLLMGTLVAAIGSTISAARVALDLPVIRVARITTADMDVLNKKVRHFRGEARTGEQLQHGARIVSAAALGFFEIDAAQQSVANLQSNTADTDLPRLQLACLRMIMLRDANTPAEQWWPQLRAWLSGLSNGRFDHRIQPHADALTPLYEQLPLDAGSSRAFANRRAMAGHSIFLQTFDRGLATLLDERTAANADADVAALEKLRFRLLKLWTLAPAPAAVRLLAAARLATALEEAPTSDRTRVAESLRAWRERVRAGMLARPVTVLDSFQSPAPAPREDARLLARVGLLSWLTVAALAAMVATLAFGWTWALDASRALPLRRALVGGLIAALIAIAGWLVVSDQMLMHDLRCDFSTWRYTPKHPLLALVFSALGLTAGTLVGGRPARDTRGWLRRIGGVSAAALLLLSVTLMLASFSASAALRARSNAVAAALQNPVAEFGGADSERLLAPLRTWQP